MILETAQNILVNGNEVQAVIVNGNVVWPVGSRYTYSFVNTSGIPMGLTAVYNGTTAYTLSNYTGAFNVTFPSGTKVYMTASTPFYRRPHLNILQGGGAITYYKRTTGVLGQYPATAFLSSNITSDASFSLDVERNDFYYSGIFNSGSYHKAGSDWACSFTDPAELTAMSPVWPWGSAWASYYGSTVLTGTVQSSYTKTVKSMPTGIRYSAVSAQFNVSGYAYQNLNSVTGSAFITLNLGSLCLSSWRTMQGRTGARFRISGSSYAKTASTAIFEIPGSTWSSSNYFGSRMALHSYSNMTGTIYSGDWTMSGIMA